MLADKAKPIVDDIGCSVSRLPASCESCTTTVDAASQTDAIWQLDLRRWPLCAHIRRAIQEHYAASVAILKLW